MNTLIHNVYGDCLSLPDDYMRSPLPISEKTEIVLVYPKCGHWIVVTLEPDLWFEQLPPEQKLMLSPDGASHRYHFAYTANRRVGDDIESLEQQVGRWDLIPADGLYLETDTDEIDEVHSVMSDALCALYEAGSSASDQHINTVQ